MAIVTTTFTVSPSPYSFSGITDLVRSGTYAAQGEIAFSELSGDLSGAGVGNESRLLSIMDCPANFAVALMDFSLSITGDTAASTNNWPDRIQARVQNSVSLQTADQLGSIEMLSHGETNTGPTGFLKKTWSPCKLPTGIFRPLSGDNVRCVVDSINDTANDQDYTLDLYVRFLQYTIEQANQWEVNSSRPVR